MTAFLALLPIVAGLCAILHLGHLFFGIVHRDVKKFLYGLLGLLPLLLAIWAFKSFDTDGDLAGLLMTLGVIILFGSMSLYDDPQERW